MTTSYEIGSVQIDPLQLWSKEVLWGREGRSLGLRAALGSPKGQNGPNVGEVT